MKWLVRLIKLNANKAIEHYKAKGLDLSAILHSPKGYNKLPLRNSEKQDHGLENVIDVYNFKRCSIAIFRKGLQTLIIILRIQSFGWSYCF